MENLTNFSLYDNKNYVIPYLKILELKNRDFPEYIEAEKQLLLDPENPTLQQKVSKEQQKKNLTN